MNQEREGDGEMRTLAFYSLVFCVQDIALVGRIADRSCSLKCSFDWFVYVRLMMH